MTKRRTPNTKPKGEFVLAMHLSEGVLFVQRHPQRWQTEIAATLAAKEKAAKYNHPFSVLKFIGTTRIPARAVQFDLFK